MSDDELGAPRLIHTKGKVYTKKEIKTPINKLTLNGIAKQLRLQEGGEWNLPLSKEDEAFRDSLAEDWVLIAEYMGRTGKLKANETAVFKLPDGETFTVLPHNRSTRLKYKEEFKPELAVKAPKSETGAVATVPVLKAEPVPPSPAPSTISSEVGSVGAGAAVVAKAPEPPKPAEAPKQSEAGVVDISLLKPKLLSNLRISGELKKVILGGKRYFIGDAFIQDESGDSDLEERIQVAYHRSADDQKGEFAGYIKRTLTVDGTKLSITSRPEPDDKTPERVAQEMKERQERAAAAQVLREQMEAKVKAQEALPSDLEKLSAQQLIELFQKRLPPEGEEHPDSETLFESGEYVQEFIYQSHYNYNKRWVRKDAAFAKQVFSGERKFLGWLIPSKKDPSTPKLLSLPLFVPYKG